jgi:hypothetical protein
MIACCDPMPPLAAPLLHRSVNRLSPVAGQPIDTGPDEKGRTHRLVNQKSS